jgi:hypothetical protein
MSIPKVIWQTYKDDYEVLPKYIREHAESWKTVNPGYEYNYMSDEQAAQFVLEKYGQEYHDIFVSLPVGVMRGDMWRYLVVYEYGGIYADLDTICKKPIDEWLKEKYNMIVCPENEVHLCQWTPKHPLIGSVIELMMSRLKNPQFNIPHAVHIHTGPAMWTEGILRGLGVFSEEEIKEYKLDGHIMKNLIHDAKLYNGLEKSEELGFFIYGGDDYRIFHEHAVQHIYGSQNWDTGYVQWIKHVI